MKKNLVAIVGRPNVGKSSLFNKLIGKRVSIVHNTEGVTRDRLYYDVEWSGKNFEIIDTGGITFQDQPFQEQIRAQAQVAINEAAIIALVVDGKVGLTNDDKSILSLLRKSNKPVVVLANKLEGNCEMDYSIYSVGFDTFSISAIHGDGIGDVLDFLISHMDFSKEVAHDRMKLSIIGRPNVGKSSLFNNLSQEERVIVSPLAGTTRDSVKEDIDINGQIFHIIDTAGIQRKSKLIESIEHYALARAFSSIHGSNLTLLVLDATKDISHFDLRIAGYALDEMKPLIIVVNKWDLISKEINTMSKYEKKIRQKFKFLSWAPIVFISAINFSKLDKLKDIIIKVSENLNKNIKTSLLNEMIIDIQMMQAAPSFNGGRLSISFIKQVTASIPTFVLFVNNKQFVHFSYLRFIKNQLREYFGFEGTPIKLVIKNKKRG